MKITLSWLTIVSFCINLLLSGLGLYQYLDAKKQEENLKMVVRSWQNQAEGLSGSLTNIAFGVDKFTSKEDMALAVSVASNYAYSLNNALAQQRFYTDDEVKVQKEESARRTQELLDSLKKMSSADF